MTIVELTHMLTTCFELQDNTTKLWHEEEPQVKQPNLQAIPTTSLFTQLVLDQHLSNFQIWHVEDTARRRDVNFSVIADCKYRIDKLNQKRNDRMENIDYCFLKLIQPLLPPNSNSRLNSESLGMIIDRASILSLKIWHMHEQTERTDIPTKHTIACQKKLNTLKEQRMDLTHALIDLIHDFHQGVKRPKLYYQYKMYNDPTLNPELYQTLTNS